MEKRITVVFAFFFLFYTLIIIRLFYWQVLSSDRLGGLAERQRLVTIPISAARGQIFATDGSSLVINQKAYGVYLEPKKMKNQADTLNILSKELGIEMASISANLKNDKVVWLPIAHKVDESVVDKIKENNLPAVEFLPESKRYYPEGSMAAHLLGFVGKNTKGDDQGYFGIEGYYEEQLKGRGGSIRQEIDANGNPILSGDMERITADNGRDLTLHIDRTIQFIVEKYLLDGMVKYGASGGSVIVMEPFTGGILAMASFPSYEPNNFFNYTSEVYKNPAISMSYEPGSTFKIAVMSMGLNDGKVDLKTKYNEDGPVALGGFAIKTWNQKYHGEISLTQILEYSSNPGMVFIQNQIGKDSFYDYLQYLGIGKLTNIDLQDEATPQLREKNKWYEIDYATAAFGQGIAVTPLQMIRSVVAVANGGKLMEPHVVKKIHLNNGKTIEVQPKIEKQIFSEEKTRIVTEMMVAAVENGETRFLKPHGYRVAGKTGTAQIPIAGHYDSDKTIASFVGFAPADKPKFVMLVTLVEPTSSPWGSETAAPLFFNIVKEVFAYLGISSSD